MPNASPRRINGDSAPLAADHEFLIGEEDDLIFEDDDEDLDLSAPDDDEF